MKHDKSKEKQNLPALSIIIPVFNEDKNIIETLKSIKRNLKVSHEILIIYDYEKDTTLPVIRKIRPINKNLRLIKNNLARGPSGAIRTGIKAAKGQRILVTMADLCDDLTQVKDLLKLVPAKADIACPSRYSKGGAQELNSPLKVGFPRLAGFLLKFFTGIPTSDPTNSFKMYSGKLVRSLSLSSTISFSVTLEIVSKSYVAGARILEIPTIWKDRQYGKTNFKLWSSLTGYFTWFCLALLRNRIFWIKPSLKLNRVNIK